jgi:hypothetical protein
MSDEHCPSDISAFLQDARRNLTVVRQGLGLESQRYRDMEAAYREVAQRLDVLPAFEAVLRDVRWTKGEGRPSSA